MWTYVKWECRRQFRLVRFWGSLFSLVLLGALFAYGYSQMHGQAAVMDYVGRGLANGFFVPILALIMSTSIMLPFFVTLFSADSIAGERQLGTWATLLTHGVNPWSAFWAKWLVGLGYGILATVVLSGSSLMAGFLLFGLHGSALPSGINAAPGDFWRILMMMMGYAVAGLAVVSTFALIVSAFSRHAVSAIMVTMGSLIVLAMLGDLPFLTRVRDLFFTSYFSRISDVLSYPPNGAALWHGLVVYALYMVFFSALVLWFQPFRD